MTNNELRTNAEAQHRARDSAGFLLEMRSTWRAANAFAPDRLRCFLQHLQQLTEPIRIADLPRNLYTAADKIAAGGTLSCSLMTPGGAAYACLVRVEFVQSDWLFSLHLGAFENLYGVFTSPAVLDILRAGGRMLACESAELSITAHTNIDADHHPPGLPIATWLSAAEAPRRETPGMTMVAEEWDGARLLLRAALPETLDSRLIIRFLLQSTIDEETLARTLAQALRSPDWRTRMCEMIAVARRGLRSLGLAVKQTDVPTASTPGVTSALRHDLLAIQKASLLLLSGTPIPPLSDEAPDTRPGMQAHLLRAMNGQPLAFEDDFSRLISSLTEGAE